MVARIKKLVLRFYKIFNAFPFNNKISAKKTKIKNYGKLLAKCKINARGNNTIIFHKGGAIRNTAIYIRGDNNIVEIGEGSSIVNGEIWIEDNDNKVTIGSNTRMCGKIHLACTEGSSISIGNDCLFSSEIVFRTGDSHSIVDMSGNRINQAADILIGDHVWVGHRVLINKGVVIKENSVVGTGAIVTKPFDESNVVIVGIPAKITKRNVDWKVERI